MPEETETKETPDLNKAPKKRARRKPRATEDKMGEIISKLEVLMDDPSWPKALDKDVARIVVQCKAIKFMIAAR